MTISLIVGCSISLTFTAGFIVGAAWVKLHRPAQQNFCGETADLGYFNQTAGPCIYPLGHPSPWHRAANGCTWMPTGRSNAPRRNEGDHTPP